jgi:hypothetical protein
VSTTWSPHEEKSCATDAVGKIAGAGLGKSGANFPRAAAFREAESAISGHFPNFG